MNGPSGADLNGIGIELLINPKKRGGAGSDAESIVSAISGKSGSGRSSSSNAMARSMRNVNPSQPAFNNFAQAARPPPPATNDFRLHQEYVSGSASEEGSEENDDDEYEEESEQSFQSSNQESELVNRRSNYRNMGAYVDPKQREMDELKEKREILYQFDRLQKKGVRLPQVFTMSSSLEELRAELNRLKTDKEVDASVRFQRRMLMACVTGIEFLNNKFDPLDIKLEGWSDSINENIDDYDDVFEELYMKYRGKAKMAPELKLLFMVGGSAVMFHLTNSMLKTMMPGMDQVLKQNPELVSQFTRATMNTMMGNNSGTGRQQAQMPQPQQPQQSSGLGMIGSLFGSLFGGGGGGTGAFAPPPAPPSVASTVIPGTPNTSHPPRQMRGPVAVDDILSELQHNAFSSGAPQKQSSNRIEVVSNASDSDISELLQDATVMQAGKKRR